MNNPISVAESPRPAFVAEAETQFNAVVQSQAPLTDALRSAGVRFVVVDAGPRPTSRLPGFTMIIDQPGLAVYELTGYR